MWPGSQWIPCTEESGEDGRSTFQVSGTMEQKHGGRISMHGEPHIQSGGGLVGGHVGWQRTLAVDGLPHPAEELGLV